MIVRAFCRIGRAEYLRDGKMVETVRLSIDRPPKIVQPKEYILHKKFIDENWGKILEKIKEELQQKGEENLEQDEDEKMQEEDYEDEDKEMIVRSGRTITTEDEEYDDKIKEYGRLLANFLKIDDVVGVGDLDVRGDLTDEEVEKICEYAEKLLREEGEHIKVIYEEDTGLIRTIETDE